jgi:hypothetical protein
MSKRIREESVSSEEEPEPVLPDDLKKQVINRMRVMGTQEHWDYLKGILRDRSHPEHACWIPYINVLDVLFFCEHLDDKMDNVLARCEATRFHKREERIRVLSINGEFPQDCIYNLHRKPWWLPS